MKTLSYTLCAVLAAGFAFTGDAQVKPKSKKVTELKYSGRIQAQWDGIESDGTTKEDRNHFYFRRLFLGGHAKMGDNWGGDVVMDFAASPNSDSTVFIEGASVWYNTDSFRIDIGQKKVPFGVEETTSSSKLKAQACPWVKLLHQRSTYWCCQEVSRLRLDRTWSKDRS